MSEPVGRRYFRNTGPRPVFSRPLGTVTTCAISRCSSTSVVLISTAEAAEFNEIALDATNVYVLAGDGFGGGEVLKCAKAGCPNGPTVLVSGLNAPIGFAVDEANVYLTEYGNSPAAASVGRVAKCAVDGCNNTPTVIADHIAAPMGIAVDGSRVYWVTQGTGPTDGEVHIAAK